MMQRAEEPHRFYPEEFEDWAHSVLDDIEITRNDNNCTELLVNIFGSGSVHICVLHTVILDYIMCMYAYSVVQDSKVCL